MCSASRLFSASNNRLPGNSCFTVSMIADLAEAARVFGNRGYRYVYFEAGAIGQRLYVGAEALGWNATGIGAFYDDDVHRYLGFLEEGTEFRGRIGSRSGKSGAGHAGFAGFPCRGAESRDSRGVRSRDFRIRRRASCKHENNFWGKKDDALPHKDPSKLPRQVIYHFAVGRAVPDPRLEA